MPDDENEMRQQAIAAYRAASDNRNFELGIVENLCRFVPEVAEALASYHQKWKEFDAVYNELVRRDECSPCRTDRVKDNQHVITMPPMDESSVAELVTRLPPMEDAWMRYVDQVKACGAAAPDGMIW